MKTTYDFGFGPVPAHRHKNLDGSEGGWVADTATVAATAYVGPHAQIFDEALVSGKARVFDEALVSGKALVFGNALVCKTPISITGLTWGIDITDRHIRIGCQQHTAAEWASWTPEDVAHMHADAKEFWRANKDTIIALAKAHAALDRAGEP